MKYNVNELLEMKKSLEQKLQEMLAIRKEELLFTTVKTIDYTNEKNNREVVARSAVKLDEYITEYTKAVDELSKVKTAIQKHNADVLTGKICEREALRRKILYLNTIKANLGRDKQFARTVTRKDTNQVTLEVQETTAEPMFQYKEIEKLTDEFAKQERKINTEIQRLNLEKTIEL